MRRAESDVNDICPQNEARVEKDVDKICPQNKTNDTETDGDDVVSAITLGATEGINGDGCYVFRSTIVRGTSRRQKVGTRRYRRRVTEMAQEASPAETTAASS